ncbi:MAG: type II secretion system F family protein [Candidatus Riflebacteria bacterium]|nr:type II secretion system F family protein [Candidatus Riflebacteria bacterium]
MPRYIYRGIDKSGNNVNAEESGSSEGEVIAKLVDAGMSVLSIQEKTPAKEFFANFKLPERGVSNKELKYFYVNLAALIDSGCTLRSSIASLADQSDNPTMKKALTDINLSIGTGKSFSEAVQEHPKIFESLFVSLVKAGEEGGILDQILLKYADYSENQEKIRSRVKGALVLPAIVILAAIGVVIGLLTYVFPTFMQLFKGKEALLPAPTQWVMWVSDTLRFRYMSLIIYLSIIIGTIWSIIKTDSGWRTFCKFQLRVPLFGTLFKRVYVARFAHTLGSLLKGGVPALRALKISADTIPNVEVIDAILEIYRSVELGGSFSAPMAQNKHLFPTMVILMVSVGETTGKLDSMLEKIGSYFDAEVQEAVAAILTAIEPILTVFLGIAVLIIALSMFLPLFNINQILK